jgi:hypothetical protein
MLFPEALLLLCTASPILRFAPSFLTGRLVTRAAANQPSSADRQVVVAVARAVKCASRRVPGSTCLAQALAGWAMLTRRHEGAVVRLGVNRDAAGGLLAHAWLECNGEKVLGGRVASAFVPFPPIS